MTQAEFEEVYRTHFTYVYRYALGLTANPELAQEITSTTFFKAINALDRYRGTGSITTWLCSIAKNTYLTHRQKSLREQPTETLPEGAVPGPEELLVDQDSAMAIHQILHRLPEPYKEVFTLRVLGELSFRQIGRILDKTENWACVTYHRARQKIQKEMEESL